MSAEDSQPEPAKKAFSFKLKEGQGSKLQKPLSKPDEDKPETDFVKGIDGGGEIQSVVPKVEKKAVVIPCNGNTWNPYGKKQHKDLILRDKTNESIEDQEAIQAVLADAAKFEEEQNAKEGEDDPARRKVREMAEGAKVSNEQEWFKNTGKGKEVDDDDESEEASIKKDIASRPDECTEEEYEQMPIEDFGVGLLRGMGWDGGAIGGRNKGLAEPVMFVPRGNGYAGLGAEVRPKSPPKRTTKDGRTIIKPGESREPKEALAAPVGPDGRVRHYAGLSEKLTKAEHRQVAPGARVEVVDGKHKGVYAVVLKMDRDGDRPQIELMMANGERLMVRREEIELVDRTKIKNDMLEKKTVLGKGNGAKPEGFQGGILGGADVFNLDKPDPKRKARDEEPIASKKAKPDVDETRDRDSFWLRSDIRVRVVCKKLGGGGLYLKKARVLDVIGHKLCTVQMEESSQIVDNVKQKLLETVLPKPGGTIMVLVGQRKGQRGKLVEKNNKKEIMQVQFFNDRRIDQIHLDDGAEYLGGANDLAE